MTRAEVERRVLLEVECIPTEVGMHLYPEDYHLKAVLEDLGFDSDDIAELQTTLKRKFEREVKFEFTRKDPTKTVSDFVDVIMAAVEGKR